MRKKRRYYLPEDKVAIIKQHLVDKISIKEICFKQELSPTIYYRWQKQLFDKGYAAFKRTLLIKKDEEYRALRGSGLRVQREEAARKWMLDLLQGRITLKQLYNEFPHNFTRETIFTDLDFIKNRPLRFRNRAIFVFSYLKGIRVSMISRFLLITRSKAYNWVRAFKLDCNTFLNIKRSSYIKYKDLTYIDAVFSILHSPPESYGVNRTSWRQKDIYTIMRQKGLLISKRYISLIIKNAGFHYRKAKKVLTSTDPDYRKKLERITHILSHLGAKEKFFSIVEFGPFAIKIQGGITLVKRGHARTVPQYQKSKGNLIITGALELSSNQITHFYSKKKNTGEMIRLLKILVKKYCHESRIYLSWDAGSWHASKALYRIVDEINDSKGGKAFIELAPLPASAQFLNVIESVFSGMAKALLHNSNYQSVEDCMKAIDRHFTERNEYFRKNPKRAGNKIWGKERVAPKFSASNNCKDPRYQR